MSKIWIYEPYTLLDKVTKYIKAKQIPTPWINYVSIFVKKTKPNYPFE